MRGSVVKKAGRWYVVVESGRDTAGKRVRKWHSGYATRKEAERARTEILSRLDGGTYVEPLRQTYGDFLEQDWLPAIRTRVRPSTWDSYARNVRLHIVPELGSERLQAITPARLNRLYAEMLESGRIGSARGLAPKTVRYVHGIIRKAFADAVRWNVVQRNVADLADPPKVGAAGREMQAWTADELRTFLEHIADERLYAAYFLAATTGMRRGEILGLRWQDVDLDVARLSVRQTIVNVAYEIKVAEPKTARSRRSIALDQHTVAVLRAWRKVQLEDRMLLGDDYENSGLVFTREDGRFVHPDRYSQLCEKLVASSQLRRIRLHDLRHTHATLALAAGVHPKVVSERLGHATVAFTLDVYSHAVPALQEEAADRVAALVFGS
jgi:integrase